MQWLSTTLRLSMQRSLESWYRLTTPEPLPPDDDASDRYETRCQTRLASAMLLVLALLWVAGSPLGAAMLIVFVAGS
jgi:hypothetical protein